MRNRNHSDAQWAGKRFCERWCAAQRLRKPPRLCACGCGGQTENRRKWIQGHRPLRLQNGYVRVWAPGHPMSHRNGSALEHRKIAYDAGWEIPDGYHVHHKNGIRHDNRLENLEVVEIAEHTRRHWKLKPAPPACPQGHEFTAENTAHNPGGWRYCKQCNRDRARRRKQADRVADGIAA